jgi:selenocysteine lyase/cysteine desulfurase
VRKSNVKNLWPLFPTHEPQADDIRKFESFGTKSIPSEHAIGQAIAFHEAIGAKHKEERLRYLKNYWCEKLAQNQRVKLNISRKPEFSCGVGHFSFDGLEPLQIVSKLKSDNIYTVPSKIDGPNGVRISPHIYTLPKDLDRFTDAVAKFS